MFNSSLAPLAQLQDSIIEGSMALSRSSVDALDRFSNLQLQTLKVSFEETGEHMSALVSATDPQAARAILEAWFAPGGQKFQSWLEHVQNISTETGTELAKDWEKHFAGNGKSLQAALESAAIKPSAGDQGLLSLNVAS